MTDQAKMEKNVKLRKKYEKSVNMHTKSQTCFPALHTSAYRYQCLTVTRVLPHNAWCIIFPQPRTMISRTNVFLICNRSEPGSIVWMY